MAPAAREKHAGRDSSGLQNVRRMFRHLGDAAALRRNPLVAHLFDDNDRPDSRAAVLARIRSCVEDAVEWFVACDGDDAFRMRRRRRYTVVLRCDLGRERWQQVAADLHIGQRQLFYDRIVAYEFVSDYVEKHLGTVARRTELHDNVAGPLALARHFANLGQFPQALAVYDDLIAHSDGEAATSFLARRTALLAEAYRLDEARASLVALRRRSSDLPQSLATALECDRAAAITLTVWKENAAAQIVCRRMLADSAKGAQATVRSAELEVEAHMQLAELLWIRRDLPAARHALNAARRVLDGMSTAPSYLEGLYAFVNFFLTTIASSSFSECAAAYARAGTALQASGQLRHFAIVEGCYGDLKRRQGDVTAAHFHVARAAKLARMASPPDDHVRILGWLALTEAAQGNRDGVDAAVRDALVLDPAHPRTLGMVALARAEFAMQKRRYPDAAHAALAAVENFEALGDFMRAGHASLAGAWAAYLSHDAIRARRWVDSAVNLAERYGSRVDVARSYGASARITGNREHRARATEMTRLLRG